MQGFLYRIINCWFFKWGEIITNIQYFNYVHFILSWEGKSISGVRNPYVPYLLNKSLYMNTLILVYL